MNEMSKTKHELIGSQIKTVSTKLAYWILFLEGIASVSIQMLVLRQTMPVSGASILHTSIVVGVFLGMLAIGYHIGGKTPKSRYLSKLKMNLLLSAALLGVGLSTMFIYVFFDALSATGFHPLVSLSVYSIVIMGPIVFLLAQTVPLLINAMQTDSHSESAGNAYAVSTIGNVLGAILTSLVVLYFFGTGYAVGINVLLLATCYLMLSNFTNYDVLWVLLGAAVLWVINVEPNKKIFVKNNAYADIAVRITEEERVLLLNNSLSSRFGEDGKAWPYIEAMKQRIALKRDSFEQKPTALVMGAGAFTISANVEDDYYYHYIDIDSDLKRVAEEHILRQPINGKFTETDARLFLQQELFDVPELKDGADIIVLDMYSNHFTIPEHLATHEFHRLVNERLSERGEVIVNLIGTTNLNDSYTLRSDATIRGAYGVCINHIVQMSEKISNILYFCKKKTSENVKPFIDANTQVSIASLSIN